MKEKIAKLIDVKSLITLLGFIALILIMLIDISVDDKVFNLFKDIMLMVITYFFARKETGKSEEK